MARERLEYDVTATGAREAERELTRVDRAIGKLSEQQTKNVRASKEFAQAHEQAQLRAVGARKADLDLADARAKLEKATKAGGGSERDRARALVAVESAEIKAARAARASGAAHREAQKQYVAAADGAHRVEEETRKASRTAAVFGKTSQAAGKATAVGFAGVSKTIGGVRLGLGGIFKGMAVGIPVAGALGVGLFALGKNLFDSAKGLEQVDRKAKAVYGKSFPEVAAWSKTVATRAGFTSREMYGLSASFADMLKPMGFTIPAATKLSERFAQMAPILAEWSGGQFSVTDTSEALMGALTGEYDTLQRLGIPISDAAVQAELLARKQNKLEGSALNQAKATAALDIIYRGSTDAQKNYANGAGTLAAKQAQASAKLKEVRDVVLEAILPAFTKAADYFLGHEDDLINWAFHAADAAVQWAKTMSLSVADILDGIGDLSISVGTFVKETVGGFARSGTAAVLLASILGVGLSGEAKKARDGLVNMATEVGDGLITAGEKAKGMADGIRTKVPPAAAAAAVKLEEMRRKALGIPSKTMTQIQVDEKAAVAHIRTTRAELRNPDLTKTRRAKLEADVKKWETQLAEIRRQKKEVARSIVIPAAAKGQPSMVRVTRVKDKAGNIVGVQVGSLRTGKTGFAAGGAVRGPGTGTSDSIPALVYGSGGRVSPAALSDGEHVLDAQDVKNLGGHDAVYAMRKQAASGRLPGFRAGGAVDLGLARPRTDIRSGLGAAVDSGMAAAVLSQVAAAIATEGTGAFNAGLAGALGFARAQVGAPYRWTGAGPKARGYDCSGFQGAITNVAKGRDPYHRIGATGSMPWSEFAAGPGAYSVGWFVGNPGHTAGTINGVNVESRGGDGVVVGPSARGARDSLFGGRIMHLKGFAAGGRVGDASPFGPRSGRGDPAFDLMSRRGLYTSGQRRPHVAMATGGVIREPVVGVGRSGRSYSFGERGAETVTPGEPGGGVLGVIDVRLNGQTIEQLLVRRKADRGGARLAFEQVR